MINAWEELKRERQNHTFSRVLCGSLRGQSKKNVSTKKSKSNNSLVVMLYSCIRLAGIFLLFHVQSIRF